MLRMQLELETQKRIEDEAALEATELTLEEVQADVREDIEAGIREECFAVFEEQLTAERKAMRDAWNEEITRNEEHMDEKIEILGRGVGVHEDEESQDMRIDDLERENQALRDKIALLTRERDVTRTPSRKLKPLKSKRWDFDADQENVEPL